MCNDTHLHTHSYLATMALVTRSLSTMRHVPILPQTRRQEMTKMTMAWMVMSRVKLKYVLLYM